MDSNNSNGSRAAWARGFAALWAGLAMGLTLMASPVAAAPFAYVTNAGTIDDQPPTVSVVDTATNTVVATIPVGTNPLGVAVTPDGKHVYVTTSGPSGLVIDTGANTVVATFPGGINPIAVAITEVDPGFRTID